MFVNIMFHYLPLFKTLIMEYTLIKGATVFNRNVASVMDVLIKKDRIEKIDTNISPKFKVEEIDASDLWLMPGIIDDQVHFREPGLTHKANIATESRAGVAGGVTSFMEMPNTKPEALSQTLLQQKYDLAAQSAYANYSFFMGVSNQNYDEVMRTNMEDVCGVKIFMGSSTGNMLVDDVNVLEKLFANLPNLIATHCEDEQTILRNLELYKIMYGDKIQAYMHAQIRDIECCYLSSSMAKALAEKHGTRLHILHISTEKELELFSNALPLKDKRITSEVCVHHLYFSADDYEQLGNAIKCNPSIKASENKKALFPALLDDRLDIIATDHAPHTWDEKSQNYLQAPSGLPLIQHSLPIMLDFYHQGTITMEKIVEKMCHAPATCFNLIDRGFIDEGMFADLVIVDPEKKWTVSKENILYKCAWSPLEGKTFKGQVKATFVNGVRVYDGSATILQGHGQRLRFKAR